MKWSSIVVFGLALVPSAGAQVQPGTSGVFNIAQTNPVVSTSTIAGKETYKIASGPDGYSLNSNLWVAEGETPVLGQVTEQLGPDWSVKSYLFDAKVGGIQQKFRVWIEDGKAHMQVTGEGTDPQRIVNLSPNMFVLDNFVPTQFQFLLNQFHAAEAKSPSQNSEPITLLVPQRLLALKGTISRSGHDTGVLQGKEIALTKYLLEAPGVKAEIWADAQNHLLGVYFSQSDIEYLREGFDLPQLKLATTSKLPSERPVSFISHGRQVLGSFMLPPENLGKKKYPAVLFVGGFGPLDRDETVGRSKPIRDIAVGLAMRGIASLRYDKPGYSTHGRADAASTTVERETIDIAITAVALAKTLPEIDPDNVFLLGHSEGGEMAPFILAKAPELRGAILMAAPGRTPEEFLPDQLAAGLRMRGIPEDKIGPRVAAVKKQLAAIHQGAGGPATLLNMPADFWRSLMQHDNVAALRDVRVPVLVLQGERDAQLSRKDFDLLTAAVPRDKLESQYFNGLDHIFAPAPDGGDGSEILIGTHVAGDVIDRIRTWLEKHRTDASGAAEAKVR